MLLENEILENLNDKYKVIQKKDGYKYGIDTVLLSKFFIKSIEKSKKNNLKVLDIGTGNGILPTLLYENKKISEIVGVDIQEENIVRAKKSLEINSMEDKIDFVLADIKNYKKTNYFDMIISNPPYMEIDGKKINEDIHKSLSRHEIKLSLEDFIFFSKKFLKPIGELCFIHRTHRLFEILEELKKNNFCISKVVFIYSENKKSSMMYVEALKGRSKKLEVESYYMKKGEDFS